VPDGMVTMAGQGGRGLSATAALDRRELDQIDIWRGRSYLEFYRLDSLRLW
jgi:hypothetical protein